MMKYCYKPSSSMQLTREFGHLIITRTHSQVDFYKDKQKHNALIKKIWSLDSEFEKAYYVDDSSCNIKAMKIAILKYLFA